VSVGNIGVKQRAISSGAFLREATRGPKLGVAITPIVLVLDNGPIHTSKASRAALTLRAHWLTVEWLPKYAPELNDIEGVWRDLKRHHLAHQTFTGLDDLDCTIQEAVINLNTERKRTKAPSVGQPENRCLRPQSVVPFGGRETLLLGTKRDERGPVSPRARVLTKRWVPLSQPHLAHTRGMLVRHPLRADRIQSGAAKRRPESSEADPNPVQQTASAQRR
jgi:transposase